MVGNALRALWSEPRPEPPPVRRWWDWSLVGALVAWSIWETLVREDLAWPLVALSVSLVIALALLWRRSHPLGAVVVAFGVLTPVDLARILAGNEEWLLMSVSGALLLPYSLFRWGAGREIVTGSVLILAWLIVTHIADPLGAAETVAGWGFFLASAALGASFRFHAITRIRDIEQAKLRQRNQLARELHDTVGHHLSALAIQAQAGRTVAASDPERAVKALEAIEEEASRALEEMRTMVGILRDAGEVDLSPQPVVADIERLARQVDGGPRIDVQLSGGFDELSPAVELALYRIAQESITNAVRHARHATRITIDVVDEGEQVRLIVRDDGDAAAAARGSTGHGLVGMAERATLLRGTLRAGPAPGRGWTVDVVFPRAGVGA